MARFASQAKMGYYPTPPAVAAAIGRSLMRQDAGLIRALDPTCGEGTALCLATAQLGGEVERYGVELHPRRAQAARAQLTKVLRCDLRTTRIQNGAFGALILNPPYDWMIGQDPDEAAQRLEQYFLQASMRYLAPGGVLVYLIPDRRLNGKIANFLAYHLERIQVFRFPGEAYQAFRQVAILGIRKPKPMREDEVLARLKAIGKGTQVPPDLPAQIDPPYPVPTSSRVSNLLFQSLVVEPEDLVEEIQKHGIYQTLAARLHPETAASRVRPLMPLRRGHIALVLASGHMNNEIVEHPTTHERLLVKGRTEKEPQRTEEVDDHGNRTITERDHLKIVITTLDLTTGVLETIR